MGAAAGTQPTQVLDTATLDRLTAEFDERGYIQLPLLSRSEVSSLREAFAADRGAHPDRWTLRGADSRGGPTGEMRPPALPAYCSQIPPPRARAVSPMCHTRVRSYLDMHDAAAQDLSGSGSR